MFYMKLTKAVNHKISNLRFHINGETGICSTSTNLECEKH